MIQTQTQIDFAVYLLEAEHDDQWVEAKLAHRLKDDENLPPYFFKWESIPGTSRQQSMVDGFKKSKCCAVCLGEGILGGLEKRLQELATERQANNPDNYRLIPVLLPGCNSDSVPEFLLGVDRIDFRTEDDFEEQFYRLVCGIQNIKPGPRPVTAKMPVAKISQTEQERIAKQYQVSIKTINDVEREGLLSKAEAEKLREKATNTMMELIRQNVSVAQVNVQESRADRS